MREYHPCVLCHATAEHRHHVFYGSANRRLSEQYGMVEWLCRRCHDAVHNGGPQGLLLKMAHQARFEQTHTRDEFMQIFGRSWL